MPKRRIENLPRTGIEYPIMKLQTQFITQHKEQEPLNEKATAQSKIDEYIANDAERANQPIRKYPTAGPAAPTVIKLIAIKTTILLACQGLDFVPAW